MNFLRIGLVTTQKDIYGVISTTAKVLKNDISIYSALVNNPNLIIYII